MTPDTLHLLASLVRHGRGIATSVEKWVRSQPHSPACRELLQLSAVARGVLTTIESQVAGFDVALFDAEEDERAEVAQPTRVTPRVACAPQHHLTQVK